MSRKRERDEMIAYENKLMEAYALEHQLHREFYARGMNHALYRAMVRSFAGITERAPRTRATIDAYIDQLKRRLEVLSRFKVSEN